MISTTLASYANLALYSAMAVFSLAMIGYAVYLAGLAPSRSREVADAVPADALVGASAAYAGGPGRESGTIGRTAGAQAGPPLVSPSTAQAGGIAWTLTLLGTAILVLSVFLRAASVQRWPLGNMFEFAVVGSMFVMVLYCVWSFRRPLRWLGLFVVAPVLLMLGLALTVWYAEADELMPSLKSVWLAIHVTVATISVALFVIGVALALLYLSQARLETTGRSTFMSRLPDARSLEKLTYMVHIVAFPLWTFTVTAGAIWARQAWGSYWNWDPKEVWSFVIWVLYAAYLHARATAGWSRRAATWIAVGGFGCIILNYAVVNMYFVGQHSYSGL